MKIGRNERCPCGSGKKYKKCCMYKDQAGSNNISITNNEPEAILSTTTGDLFQPVRLYYEVSDMQALHEFFQTLGCMQYDKLHSRWVWLYINEAKKVKLPTPYNKIPKKLHPIVIGSFFNNGNTEVFLDLRSTERAEQAILFFDQYIDRKIAKITHAAIRNRFSTDKKETSIVNYDYFFPSTLDSEINSLNDTMDNVTKVNNSEEQRLLGLKMMNDLMNRPIPEVEKMPLFYYEEGMDAFKLNIAHSKIVAKEYLNGNKNITFNDIMDMITK